MASQIETILDEIAAWEPTYDTETVTVWNIDDVRVNLEPMQVPRRILGLEDGSEFAFICISGGSAPRANIIWTITDTLYIAPVNEMASFRRHYGDMIRYAGDYSNKAQADRGLASNLAHVQNVAFESGVFAWPEGSENQFFGVRAVLQVQEVI